MQKHWLAIMLVVLSIGFSIFILAEPFLSLSPIWEQASVGMVLVGYGAILMFGTVAVQKWLNDYRAAKRSPKRVRFGHALPRDRQDWQN